MKNNTLVEYYNDSVSYNILINPVIFYDKLITGFNNINDLICTNKSILTNSNVNNIVINENVFVKKCKNKCKKEFYIDNNCFKNKNDNKLITSNNIKINLPNFTYKGSIVNGKLSGNGVLIQSGNKYEGEFQNNKKNGIGFMQYQNGDIYFGLWKNDKRYGNGIFKCAAHIYDGEWFNDTKYGKGTLIYINGIIYEGDWANDKKHGYGTYIWPNSKYIGYWSNDKRNGYGTYIWSDGSKYEGEWLNDQKNGKGSLLLFKRNDYNEVIKCKYIGDWTEGKKNGYGNMFYNNGDIFQGQWFNDKRDKGILFCKDGNTYYNI